MQQRVVYLLGPEVVEVREDPVPVPGPGEAVVAIGAATTCGTDVKVFRRGGHPRMLRPPCPFGHEFAGTVSAVGRGVTRWREGDRVVVANSASCGVCRPCREGRENLCRDLQYLNGAFAGYITVPARFVERSLYGLPDELSFELAALSEPLACVLHGMNACGLDGPKDVAVYGAGPIGLLFAGALVARGHRVVVADLEPRRLGPAMALGARTVALDGSRPAAELVRDSGPASGGFDVAIDATGHPDAWVQAIRSVSPGGTVNLFGGCAPGTTIPLDTHLLHYGEITVKGVYHHRPATFVGALETLARGDFEASVLLSREAPVEQAEEALRAMMRGEALKVVLRP